MGINENKLQTIMTDSNNIHVDLHIIFTHLIADSTNLGRLATSNGRISWRAIQTKAQHRFVGVAQNLGRRFPTILRRSLSKNFLVHSAPINGGTPVSLSTISAINASDDGYCCAISSLEGCIHSQSN